MANGTTRLDSPTPLTSLHKRNHACVKLGLIFLFVGFAFSFIFSDSFLFSPETLESPDTTIPTTETEKTSPNHASSVSPSPEPSPLTLPSDFPATNNIQPSPTNATNEEEEEGLMKCDIFKGDWIPDSSGPRYTNDTCRLIESHQNCMRNGRPDSAYIYWKWRPTACELPKFDPQRFLDQMRHKSWAFIGDSISRNHVQSLLCILSQVEQPMEVYHDEEYRSKTWHFRSHNLTIAVVWAPFLVKALISEDTNGISSSTIQLHLDELDKSWTKQYDRFDYAVISGGKWFLKASIFHENNTVTGCHYCRNNLTELGFDHSYRKALRLALGFALDPNRGPKTVFLRTATPDHFENGEWFSGGYCNRTVPFRAGQAGLGDVDRMMREVELEEFRRAVGPGNTNEVGLKLLDTTGLSLLRPDGHPGPYRQFQPFAREKHAKVQTDCLHWCLPGPIDSWNDLLMDLLSR